MRAEKICGLVAPPFAPFKPDGSLWLDPVAPYAAMLARNGVNAVFVNGTTGEMTSLTIEEREALVERWVREAPRGMRVIVHAGSTCLAESRRSAAHAQRVGAHAVSMLPPFYFRPSTVDELVSCCSEVAAAAPGLPFYYYHIPAKSGVTLPMRDFLEQAAPRIPNLAGIKFTYENLMDFGECVDCDGGRFNMLFGRDEILLCGLALGADGAVGTSYNFLAPLYLRMMEAWSRGDREGARVLQRQAQVFFREFFRFGPYAFAALKALMRLVGVDCGPTRLPVPPMEPRHAAAFEAAVRDSGFENGRCR
jgi:N-acetylneuraminate lyase